jgi:hypothetical protein
VLVTKTTHDLVGGRLGGGFGLRRLGEFRLRDLAEPEVIYQVTHADLPADFPPIVTVAERTGNLPSPVSSFIGRARELEQTGAALGQARVVTLTGPGGVGTTPPSGTMPGVLFAPNDDRCAHLGLLDAFHGAPNRMFCPRQSPPGHTSS